jgi:SAM-dependent methyltransferase
VTGDLGAQIGYWNTVGATKTYGHPLDLDLLADVPRSAPVLDVGCGYGRIAGHLADAGFTDVTGVDFAPAMIERARRAYPLLRFEVQVAPPALARADASVALVTLFAVLTCIPGDDGQRATVAEIRRVLRPGGLCYVSDLCLQDDDRNRERYARDADRHGRYGVFATGDGAVCRHHDPSWFDELFEAFAPVTRRSIPVATMNGHDAIATQLLLRRT